MTDLKSLLNNLDISAEWIGLREVKETKTYRSIRDLNPQSNTSVDTHGIMVEVLCNGQFGYAATNDMTLSGVNNASMLLGAIKRMPSKNKLVSILVALCSISIGGLEKDTCIVCFSTNKIPS